MLFSSWSSAVAKGVVSGLLGLLALQVQSASAQSTQDEDIKAVPLRTHSLYQVRCHEIIALHHRG